MPQKITYIRRVENIEVCPVCQGNKKVWDSYYHNQTRITNCHRCKGKGSIPTVEETDITPELTVILNQKENTMP